MIDSMRPKAVLVDVNSLFACIDTKLEGSTTGNLAMSKNRRAIVPRFGAEQVLNYLREQQSKMEKGGSQAASLSITVVASGEAAVELVRGVESDLSLKCLLQGVSVLACKHVLAAGDGPQGQALLHAFLQEQRDETVGVPSPWAAARASRRKSVDGCDTASPCSDSVYGNEQGQAVVLVIESSPCAPSPCASSPLSMPAVCVAVYSAAGVERGNPVDSIARSTGSHASNGHGPDAIPCTTLLHQQAGLSDLSQIDWRPLGLPPLEVDVQNPPFLWPRDYERALGLAQLVEARWWDLQHGQLNLVLGRAVHAENVLEVVAEEMGRRGEDGTVRAEGLDSLFVTVRHDFGIIARLLEDGYRIHHAGGGGTQVVLLRLFVKVEVPTAGTHICRSKVILYRTRRRGRAGFNQDSKGSAPMGMDVSGEGSGRRQGEGRVAARGEGDSRSLEVFLFRRRSKGIYKMPGGHVELKELADEAAVREVREETGFACRVVGMVALTERKDVGKKWGCSQLMFTFAAEWVESEMRLDDAVSREGSWFALEEVDAMVAQDSQALDPPLKKVWPAFRARGWAPAAWFRHHPQCIDPGYETRKRCYMLSEDAGSEEEELQGRVPEHGKAGSGMTSSSSLMSASSSTSSFLPYHPRALLRDSCVSSLSCGEGASDWEGRSST